MASSVKIRDTVPRALSVDEKSTPTLKWLSACPPYVLRARIFWMMHGAPETVAQQAILAKSLPVQRGSRASYDLQIANLSTIVTLQR
eukprot:scaffold326776_cov30-Prasinocladus_malaysianus.AAC.2